MMSDKTILGATHGSSFLVHEMCKSNVGVSAKKGGKVG